MSGRWWRDPRLVRLAQLITAGVFAAAGLAKIGDMASFASQVHNFRLAPVASENLVAMTLPWIELVVALALIFKLRARAGAVVAAVLMVGFTVAVALALVRGLDIECGCFGTSDATRVGASKLLQNIGLTAVAAVGALRARPKGSGS